MTPTRRVKQLGFIIGVTWWMMYTHAQILDGAQEIAALHNSLRRRIARGSLGVSVANIKKVFWDPELAFEAAQWAECSNIGQHWSDYDYDSLGIPTRGINTGVAMRNESVVRMIKRWYQERRNFDSDYNVCHFGKTCKNFMQLAASETSRVGCALRTSCKVKGLRVKFLVCMYTPGLNQADPIYREGTPCTKCEGAASFCENDLCVPCDNSEQCECRKACRKAGVGYGVLRQTSCSCDCVYGRGPNCDEPCRNPDQYLEYDICSDLGDTDCQDPDPEVRAMLDEFCPEKCSCRPMPASIILGGV